MEHQFGAMTIEQGKARGVAGGDTFLKSVYIQRKTIRESKIHGLENEIRELKALLTKGNRLIYEKSPYLLQHAIIRWTCSPGDRKPSQKPSGSNSRILVHRL